ncbi:hypothetical protein HDU76_007034 [Blyttiomyces sp. JEL0837]|nr:hypothetical protein HDU76_007034 [Blyttiomyces sp. JEL0837]
MDRFDLDDSNGLTGSLLYRVESALPINATNLGLLMDALFLFPVEQQQPDISSAEHDSTSPQNPLNVKTLNLNLVGKNDGLNFDCTFRVRLARFIHGFFPRLQHIKIRCGALMAAYKMDPWVYGRYRYDYILVIKIVAEMFRDLLKGIINAVDDGNPGRTLPSAFLENLQCLCLLPEGKSSAIDTIVQRILKYCPNITYLAVPTNISNVSADQVSNALASCRRICTLKLMFTSAGPTYAVVMDYVAGLTKFILKSPITLKYLEAPKEIPLDPAQQWVKVAIGQGIRVGPVNDPFKLSNTQGPSQCLEVVNQSSQITF